MMLDWNHVSPYLVARAGGCDFFISKTETTPHTAIPRTHKWMLEIMRDDLNICKTLPTRKACMQYAERFIQALPVLEGRDDE